MKIDVDALRRNDRLEQARFSRAVRKSARAGCVRLGLEHMADDVAQELYILFMSSLIEKFDPSYNVEPFLIESAVNVAKMMMSKQKEVCVDSNELLSLYENDISSSNDEYAEIDSPISKRLQDEAMERIRSGFPGVEATKPSRTGDPARTTAFVKEKKTSQRKLSESCALLRQIRLDLGMSQESFADALGIPTATLLSYEYGRTSTVKNQEILDKAKMLYEERKNVSRRTASMMAKPMKEIVAEWAAKIGAEQDDIRAVSNALGISHSTVHRWVHGNMRPRPIKLAEYADRIVKMALARK